MTPTIAPPKPYHYIGRCPCKGCSTIKRITVPARVKQWTVNTNWWPGCNNPPVWETRTKREPAVTAENYAAMDTYCIKHRRLLAWKQVDGTLNPDHKCDVRCTSAKGHNCECSCGGANHGADWD